MAEKHLKKCSLVLSRNDVASSTDDVTAWITNIFADS